MVGPAPSLWRVEEEEEREKEEEEADRRERLGVASDILASRVGDEAQLEVVDRGGVLTMAWGRPPGQGTACSGREEEEEDGDAEGG